MTLRTKQDMAALLRKSMSWVNHQVHRWPCERIGRTVLFTDAHVADILAMYEDRPTSVPTRDEVARKREQRGRRVA